MEIPSALLEEVKQGRVVLLLGAGASIGASNAAGESPPDAKTLARMLAERFLDASYSDLPLQVVAELAVSETDLYTVQDYIRDVFVEFNPAKFHELVATFRWHGLATTNYDLVVERAYDRASTRAQNVVPFRLNTDRILDLIHLQDNVLLLKLHGCISVTRDERTPLILTVDQYVLHRHGRSRLFETLFGWGHERPIVFIGRSMQDPDLRQLLLELAELGTTRPRFYLVTPSAPDPLTRMWEARRVSVLEGTFEDFLVTLDGLLPGPLRMVESVKTTDHPIASRFSVRGAQLSPDAMSFLTLDADFVHAAISVEELEPRAFYRGINKGWSAVERQFDVKRGLSETLLADVVLGDELSEEPTQLHVIKAEAGAGKTICLRRVAWDAATQFDRLCVWLNENGQLSPEVIGELAHLCQERVYLFVDNAAEHASDIQAAIARARREKIPLTIFTAERVNAWNMQCEDLDPFVTGVYRLPYLRTAEISDLVDRLEQHGSLGMLQGFSRDERVEAFQQRAGRQLLVALHEATQGRPFEDILVDEFIQIQPLRARSLYLSVCVLNRLNVPVRAGLIARVHDIPFSEFREELFKPLEHVVTASFDERIKDYLYAARHPEIAQIVFDRILTDAALRYDEYIRIITKMNLAFETDRVAFFQMLRARALMELFPDPAAVSEIYRIGVSIAGDEAFLYHQQAIFEMRRASGNLGRAAELLAAALARAPNAKAIMHSMAELELSRTDRAKTQLEKEHHRDQAVKLANPLRADPAKGAYGYHTLLKVANSRLGELLLRSGVTDREIDERIQEIEDLLERALERFPNDEYVLAAEAEFAQLIEDDDRVLNALRKAFTANRRSPFISRGLSAILRKRGDLPAAEKVLEEALEANPGERRLHGALATLLRESASTDVDRVIYHLRRAFTPGDDNYFTQFWYAVSLFNRAQGSDLEESRALFQSLGRAPLPHDLRKEVRARLPEVRWSGRVMKLETTYGFVQRDGANDWIFFHHDSFSSTLDWTSLARGQLVNFSLGFTFSGPIAIDTRREG